MPAPTSYSEATLAQHMVNVLGSVATDLDLEDDSPAITAAVTSIERLLGVDDVADVTDMPVLESAAAWKAWAVAYGAAVTQASEIKAGSAGLKWSDRLDGLRQAMTLAEGAYYAARAASDAASGTSSFFAFSVACGGRGR